MSLNVTAGQAATLSRHNVTIVDVPFNAANFSASGAMTWTVDAADQVAFWYAFVGELMVVSFALVGTSIGGSPNAALYVQVPAGKVISRSVVLPSLLVDAGTMEYGFIRASGSNNIIECFRKGLNWSASANLTTVYCEIVFPFS